MYKFPYLATVIIPVYNVERYLEHCLKTLFRQTVDMNRVEIILVNDGSTDDSEEICHRYEQRYDNIRLLSKPNGGLSSTRNAGLRNALGKYIFFLDADDSFSDETIENVCRFFDSHYNDVDEVTFPIVRYKQGKTLPLHYRYQFLTDTGVYDLEDSPFVSITTINVCVKNLREHNVLFNTTPNFRHEDQLYNNTILREKMKVGFVQEAEYKYNRDNESSIVSTYMYPYYIFETTMNYYETLFDSFGDSVPQYFQALFIHDLNWKLQEDRLFPFHYKGDDFTEAVNRIRRLLDKCDVEIIVNHPRVDVFHVHYWLSLKPNAHPVVVAQEDHIDVFVEGTPIYQTEYFEIVLQKLTVDDQEMRVVGFVKSPIYNHLREQSELYVIENNSTRRKMETFISSHSYHGSHFTQTNNFYAFDYSCDLSVVDTLRFEVDLDGFSYTTVFWFMPAAVFSLERGVTQYVRGEYLLKTDGVTISLSKLQPKQSAAIQKAATKRVPRFSARLLRRLCLNGLPKKNIWLYYDAYTVDADNGLFQFKNDFKHSGKDKVKRYYVMFPKTDKSRLSLRERFSTVRFGSLRHKLLYIQSQRVFTAYFGFSPVSPFRTEEREADYIDLIQYKTIYLQHGVLHAALRTYNSMERRRADQIVVSSGFEVWNYVTNYHYREDDLIPTGAARYDLIDRTRVPSNKILYAPSWRKYLTVSDSPSSWTLVASKLLESDYFQGIIELLTNPNLAALLQKNGLTLDVKLHPIIAKDAHRLLDIQSPFIKILDGHNVEVADYKMFITDFSSYVFDFACLNRPILYYVTDYLQFLSGMNHYKSLDLDFKDAFGPFCTDAETAINEINRVIQHDFAPEQEYSRRMTAFYVPLDNCRERLYQYVAEADGIL